MYAKQNGRPDLASELPLVPRVRLMVNKSSLYNLIVHAKISGHLTVKRVPSEPRVLALNQSLFLSQIRKQSR